MVEHYEILQKYMASSEGAAATDKKAANAGWFASSDWRKYPNAAEPNQ